MEFLIAMEVVIGGGNVGASAFANVAGGCAVKVLFGKSPEGGVQQTLLRAGLINCLGSHGRPHAINSSGEVRSR